MPPPARLIFGGASVHWRSHRAAADVISRPRRRDARQRQPREPAAANFTIKRSRAIARRLDDRHQQRRRICPGRVAERAWRAMRQRKGLAAGAARLGRLQLQQQCCASFMIHFTRPDIEEVTVTCSRRTITAGPIIAF